MLGQGCHLPRAPIGRPGLQDGDRPAFDGAVRVDDQPLGVHLQVGAQARALGAGAVGRVEREEPRRDLGQRRPAVGAGIVGREDFLGTVGHRHDDDAAGYPGRGLDRVGQALAVLLILRRFGHEAIHDDLDGVLLLFVQLGRVVQVHESAVHPGPQEPLLDHLGHLLAVLALLARHVRRQDRESAADRQAQRPVHHLLDGLGLDRPAALRAVRFADRGVEQPQVVVDLRHRADRGAGILRSRPLLDRDRRRETLDRVDVRLLHLLQELARIGGERLDVAPLPLREDRVEGEGGLPRSGDSGDDDQPVARNVAGDVLEVVLARAAYPEELHGKRDSNRNSRIS